MTTTFSCEAPSQEDIQIFAASFTQQHSRRLDQLGPNSPIKNISGNYSGLFSRAPPAAAG